RTPPELPKLQIRTVKDHNPPHRAPYRISQDEMEFLDQHIQTLLDRGYIKPSESLYVAPILFVRRASYGSAPTKLRMCVDYRGLIGVTFKDRSPLPYPEELLDRL
ncbi:DNA/RNA polymerase, partial [Ascobolus immersus RN42]